MLRLKDVESLLLQHDLLAGCEVVGQLCEGNVFDAHHFFRKRFRNELGPGGSSDAMRRKLLKLGIVGGVEASMRNQEHFTSARRIREPADVGQQLLRSGDIEFSARKHKIG